MSAARILMACLCGAIATIASTATKSCHLREQRRLCSTPGQTNWRVITSEYFLRFVISPQSPSFGHIILLCLSVSVAKRSETTP
jgi:hypothetical protein